MKEFMLKNKKIVYGSVVAVIIIIIYFYNQKPNEDITENLQQTPLHAEKKEDITQSDKQNTKMLVDVKGAVAKPGVYEAKEDNRVIDIIQKAGGFKKQADQKKVNLAEKVHDEMVIYVPVEGESAESDINLPSGLQMQENVKVNINTATLDELQTLTGIGPSKAAAIMEYREQNGGFQKVEDIKNVSGIGDKTFEKLKDSIMVR
ncbi:helix-hairpin-helix domain-containing protein [Bacillus sp. FJAT-49736]|uniref:helix-hairpin-helix domain-containing protein n=1 Tax=Bacillus sp. FJAT-49736 TaxID=2833582 RepID=UPI001BC9FED1|nr:helix-hairpin-helix domain-containing protein [Bacillus sp. FJAT-49736]MBS4173603.1 helix-hairpin-helix domain-containing protein [Bacillus sp. FJAT-49736]